ncbi:MAG: bifunctional oligoribonuclease/PAP phosphatase NrnA [Actinobacteria bacterium]|nr:bifunctional oligoribonuclease/PAP phosphatase NrnA [Actinomycetota bacterium]
MVVQSYDEIVRSLRSAKTVAVCGHVHPDGDCVGSVLALVAALKSIGIEATPLFADDSNLLDMYRFMPGYESFISSSGYTGNPDVFVALDTPNKVRLGSAGDVLGRARVSVAVDHHPDTEDFVDYCFSDHGAAACAMLVWDLIHKLEVGPDAGISTCCYTALVTDTGSFQFQNTSAEALLYASDFCRAGANPSDIATRVYQSRTYASMQLESRVASRVVIDRVRRIAYSWVTHEDYVECGATKSDGENLSDTVRSLAGIDIAILLRSDDGIVRGSIRAKDTTDVSRIAQMLGGGGHVAAAGFTLAGSIEDVLGTLLPLFDEGN